MDLLRDWRRRIAGGTAAALLIPVAIVLGSLGLGLGGFGGLGSLGQALTGPDIPGVEPASAGGRERDDAGELLASAAAARDATGARAGARTRRRAGTRPGSAPPRRRPSRPGQGPAATPTPDAGQPPPSSTPAPQPTPAPTQPPSTVRQVGDEVKKVTNQVPVAGEPAGQVVDTIVETAEQLPLP